MTGTCTLILDGPRFTDDIWPDGPYGFVFEHQVLLTKGFVFIIFPRMSPSGMHRKYNLARQVATAAGALLWIHGAKEKRS